MAFARRSADRVCGRACVGAYTRSQAAKVSRNLTRACPCVSSDRTHGNSLAYANGGPDWTAVISATAAAIQAIGAIAAIYYSGKLARDAAKRERAADEAAARRIAEADAAAEARRVADRAEAKEKEESERKRPFNLPIQVALELADAALESLKAERAAHADAANRMEANQFAFQ